MTLSYSSMRNECVVNGLCYRLRQLKRKHPNDIAILHTCDGSIRLKRK